MTEATDLYRLQRFRGLCGDFWNLAHEAVSALGAWDEKAGDWRFDQIDDDNNRLLAIRLAQLIEDYDQLVEQAHPWPRRVSPEASARALDLRQRMP